MVKRFDACPIHGRSFTAVACCPTWTELQVRQILDDIHGTEPEPGSFADAIRQAVVKAETVSVHRV